MTSSLAPSAINNDVEMVCVGLVGVAVNAAQDEIAINAIAINKKMGDKDVILLLLVVVNELFGAKCKV